jgi:gliding motility-associated-like protein
MKHLSLMKTSLLFVTFLVLLFQLPVLGQTDFSASKISGCDTLTVQFTYTTSLTVSNVAWTFGDGGISSDVSPQHKYIQPGKYLVSVKINNTDSVGKADYITIGQTPKAGFSYHDTLDFGSRTVVFVADPQSASPYPYSYEWTVSDGTTANTLPFFHKFDTTGNYTGRLIINDQLGCTDSITKTIEIKDKLNVPSVFTPNDDGLNDLFIVEGDNKTTYSFQVFTPSGIKVYESSSKVIVWDGHMFSGDKVSAGIYYYVILSIDGTPPLKQFGFFYLYL